MSENRAGEFDYSNYIGTFPDCAITNIFKKSEHEEIMDELEDIKQKVKDLQEKYPPPHTPPLPYVPPYDPCQNCCPLYGCSNCPWQYYPKCNRFYPTTPWYPATPYYDYWLETGNIGTIPMSVNTCSL